MLIATIEGDAARVTLICRNRGERLRLEPLISLIKDVIDSALERGFAGAA